MRGAVHVFNKESQMEDVAVTVAGYEAVYYTDGREHSYLKSLLQHVLYVTIFLFFSMDCKMTLKELLFVILCFRF